MADVAAQHGSFAWIRKPYDGEALLDVVNEAARQSATSHT
jgi:FixJ family two-component response regulator